MTGTREGRTRERCGVDHQETAAVEKKIQALQIKRSVITAMNKNKFAPPAKVWGR